MIKQGYLPPPVTPRLPFLDEFFSSPSVGESDPQEETNSQEDPNETLWTDVLGRLYTQMTRATFDTLLKTTRLTARDGRRFTIAAKTPFAIEWLENRLAPLIKRAIASVTGEEPEQVELNFIVT
jgi:hypothetical protein